MLVLTRKKGERVVIDERIVIEVLEVFAGKIRLGITAPPEIMILREELLHDRGRTPPPAPPSGQFPEHPTSGGTRS